MPEQSSNSQARSSSTTPLPVEPDQLALSKSSRSAGQRQKMDKSQQRNSQRRQSLKEMDVPLSAMRTAAASTKPTVVGAVSCTGGSMRASKERRKQNKNNYSNTARAGVSIADCDLTQDPPPTQQAEISSTPSDPKTKPAVVGAVPSTGGSMRAAKERRKQSKSDNSSTAGNAAANPAAATAKKTTPGARPSTGRQAFPSEKFGTRQRHHERPDATAAGTPIADCDLTPDPPQKQEDAEIPFTPNDSKKALTSTDGDFKDTEKALTSADGDFKETDTHQATLTPQEEPNLIEATLVVEDSQRDLGSDKEIQLAEVVGEEEKSGVTRRTALLCVGLVILVAAVAIVLAIVMSSSGNRDPLPPNPSPTVAPSDTPTLSPTVYLTPREQVALIPVNPGVNQRAGPCLESSFVGYKTMEDIVADQQGEWDRIQNGLDPQPPYVFPLCPNTVFNMGDNNFLRVLLSEVIFGCGPSSTGDCVFQGDGAQILFQDSETTPGYPTNNTQVVTIVGVTFSGFTQSSINVTGSIATRIEFQDCTWRDFASDSLLTILSPAVSATTMHQVELTKGSKIINGQASGSLFSNNGGVLVMDDVAFENIQGNISSPRMISMISSSGGITSLHDVSFNHGSLDVSVAVAAVSTDLRDSQLPDNNDIENK